MEDTCTQNVYMSNNLSENKNEEEEGGGGGQMDGWVSCWDSGLVDGWIHWNYKSVRL